MARAKREGFRSRAAFKLIEIDDKHHVLKGGARVVDLGAAPGGWSQVAAKRVGAARPRRRASTSCRWTPIAGVEFAQIDFLDPDAPDKLKAMLGGPADVVLSDMAANATGHRPTDHLKIMALVEAAARIRRARCCKDGGAFLAKVIQGGTEAALLAALKRDFATVKHVKPAASRCRLGGALRAGDRISRRALSLVRSRSITSSRAK